MPTKSCCLALLLTCCVPGIDLHAAASEEPPARQILDASGIKGGFIVHLGCGDGSLTAALHASLGAAGHRGCLVHGLDTDPGNVAKARRRLRSRGLLGKVSVATYDGEHLPYVDNLVNLLVVSRQSSVERGELLRVLCPGGVAVFLAADGTQRIGEKRVKPWPAGIDAWTHFLHGPDNNAVAEDTVVGPPRHVQWVTGPNWTRHHGRDKGTQPGFRTLVSANGRIFYMVDEATAANMRAPTRWFLVARDAFNGVLLWKRPVRVAAYPRRLEQLWRSAIADGDRVYAVLGTDQPLSALDGAAGTVLRSYKGTEGLSEAIKERNSLFLVDKQAHIVALRADTGERLWRWAPPKGDAVVPLTLAASGGKVFVKTDKSICCISAVRGKTLWRFVPEIEGRRTRLKWPRAKLIAKDGVVLCSYGGKNPKVLDRDRFQYLGSHPRVNEYGGRLAALSAEDGKVLWTTAYKPGLESYPGDIFVVDGKVWLGPDFVEARDLHTGEVKDGRAVLADLWTTGHHHRCYPAKATSRYILTGKRGIEMIDIVGDNHSRNNWARGTCRLGVTPCNGLIYATPHSCGCYMEAKLYGFYALAPKGEGRGSRDGGRVEEVSRLERGPAYTSSLDTRHSTLDTPSDWPTYRRDGQRSSTTRAAVPTELEQAWRADIGGRLSAITVADGKVFVAQIDAQTVHALDAGSGERLWQFTAGGRVDSPPTFHRGLLLFGSRDGCVSCLRASDGALVWRFLAAPRRVHTVAFDQVESLWPVHGSILVRDGIAYAAAGRSSYLDGGVVLYGLDPASGDVVCETRLRSEHPGLVTPPPAEKRQTMTARIRQNSTDYKTFLAPDRSDAFSMSGALNDVLVAADTSVYLRHLRFDQSLVRQEKRRPHLFSTSSLLDDREIHRSHLVLGTGDFSRTPVAYAWIVYQLKVPYGLVLVFDDTRVWGVVRGEKRTQPGTYLLFAAKRPDPSAEASFLPDFEQRSSARASGHSWIVPLPLRPRAMIRAKDALLIGGVTDRPGDAAFEGEKGGLLRVVSCESGKTLAERALGSPPVWDGMAAAGGRLFIASASGHVQCWGVR